MGRIPFSVRRVILILIMSIISSSVMAQKVNLDALNIDQLNQYKDKAIEIRNTGRALTISGVGVMVTGFVTGSIMLNTAKPFGPPEDPHGSWAGLYLMGLAGLVGIPCTLIGIPLWAVGGSRKTKAELALQKLYLAHEDSMVFGFRVTFRF